jgi:hypothetical protein
MTILLPIGALFGMAALVFQLLALTVRAAVTNAVWWAGYLADHPIFEATDKTRLPWTQYLKGAAWRLAALGGISWVFLEVRYAYLERLDEGQLGSVLSFVRTYLLTTTILAFLKAAVTVGLILLTVPVLAFWAQRSNVGWLQRVCDFSSRHTPKALPLVVYYGLLVGAISLVTNPHVFAGFPFGMSWEHFGQLLQQDFLGQLLKLRDAVAQLLTL